MCLNIFFNVYFFNQISTNIVFSVVKSVTIQYHCFKLTVHRKFNKLNCRTVFYMNWISMFQSFNVNICLSHHHCWLCKSLYNTIWGSQSSEMFLIHLLHSLSFLQLLYSHQLTLINMHHDEDDDKQTSSQLNQWCNHVTEFWIKSDMFRFNQYTSSQSCTWVRNLFIFSCFIILSFNHFSAIIVMCYISKMRLFNQVNTIFLTVLMILLNYLFSVQCQFI